MASSKAQLRKIFLDLIEALASYADADDEALSNQGPAKFFFPTLNGWSGDLFDLEGMSQAWDRSEIYEDFRNTVKDSSDSGVVADLMTVILQGDFVAIAERAFRHQASTSVRDKIHASARRRGHANPAGVLTRGIQGYVEHLDRMAKS